MESEFSFDSVMERLKGSLNLANDAALCRLLGMSTSAYANRKKAGSIPLEKIVDVAAARDIDLTFVLTGKRGVITTGSSTPPLSAREAEGRYSSAADALVQVPLYDVRAAAGFGAFIEDQPAKEALAFRRDWIQRQLGVPERGLSLIYVAGDSMEPTLSDGDVIMVNRADRAIRQEGIYVLRMDDTLLVKKLQRMPGGMVKVSSDNPGYGSFELNSVALEHGDEAQLIGRVVWAARKF